MPPAPGLRRITGPASIALLAIAAVSVALAGHGRSPAVVGGAIAAVAVAAGGTAVMFARREPAGGPDLAALVPVGLAGAALAWLMPNSLGFVVVYLALAALGMRLPLGPALAVGFGVFAAFDLATALAGQLSVAELASQDIGAAFVFAIGAFTRSARSTQEQARAAQARAEQLLSRLQASQAALAQAAALTERARLARDIHDVLAHALSGLVLTLDTMELLGRQDPAGPGTLPELLDLITRGRRIARDGLAETKSAIAALRGDELPGPALLDRLVADAAASAGIRPALSVGGAARPVPPEVGLALYRTAQEALTNSAKYAGPGARVELRLTYDDAAVELTVQDTRPAGAPAAASGLTFGGYGLTGMRERAELLGGSLTAGPTDVGFGVRLRLPAAAAAAAAGAPAAAVRPGAASGLAL
jgi:signal transduction histidine kinase